MDLALDGMSMLHDIKRAPATKILASPYSSCEDCNEASWNEIIEEISKALHAAGLPNASHFI